MLPVPPIQLEAMLRLDPAVADERARKQLAGPDFSGRLCELEGDPLTLGRSLLPFATAFSVSPISGFAVGAVAVGESGAFYLGANLEFAGTGLGATLHAEQSAVLNAWVHGETILTHLLVSDVPCGHCRQFLTELSCSDRMQLVFGEERTTIDQLLPGPFGTRPKAGQGLLDSPMVELESIRPVEDSLAQRAINAAQRSYTPYTRANEGFVIEGDNGQHFAGRAAESVAFNPSVSAIVCAMNQRNLSAGRSFSIKRCAHARLVTAVNGTVDLSKSILARISGAPVEEVLLEHA